MAESFYDLCCLEAEKNVKLESEYIMVESQIRYLLNRIQYCVQSLALTSMSEGYVSMIRAKDIIAVLTKDKINLSVGYIAKLKKNRYMFK